MTMMIRRQIARYYSTYENNVRRIFFRADNDHVSELFHNGYTAPSGKGRRITSFSEQTYAHKRRWSNNGNKFFSSMTTRNQQQQQQNNQICVSGGSYLMPTLRLCRNDTPQSIDASLNQVMLDNSNPNNNTIKSTLLQHKQRDTTTTKWMIPMVLDLSELLPDGSPHHYTPPSFSMIHGFINVLNKYNIAVLGITSTSFAAQVERFAAMLGVPTLLSIRDNNNPRRKTQPTTNSTIQLHDLARIITNSIILPTGAVENSSSNSHQYGTTSMISSISLENEQGIHTNVADERHYIQQTMEGDILQQLTTDDDTNDSIMRWKQQQQTQQGSAISTAATNSSSSRVVHGHVRSGQIVSSDRPNQSLVILGDVHSGGEVLSDGDIHVYGKLKGRAFAGLVSEDARIYVQSFDPELVCIQGIYTTIDNVTQLVCNTDNSTTTNNNSSSGSCFLKPGDTVMVSLNSMTKQLQFERIL